MKGQVEQGDGKVEEKKGKVDKDMKEKVFFLASFPVTVWLSFLLS